MSHKVGLNKTRSGRTNALKRATAIFAFFAFFFVINPLKASAETVVTLSGAVSPRMDKLSWNIAGNTNGANPNVMSELTWTGVTSFELSGHARIELDKRYFIKGYGAYAPIFAGEVRDSDYARDNRTAEYSRSRSRCDTGSLSDLSLAIGFKEGFEISEGFGYVAPYAGYSRHRQNLTMTDGRQVVPFSAAIAGLNSTYEAAWAGPLVGFDLSFNPRSDYDLQFGLELHMVDYNATADWNLRTDFAHPESFTQTAYGYGVISSLGLKHGIGDKRSIYLGAEIKVFSADNGIDRTFFIGGASADTRLNNVYWSSMLLRVRMDFDL